MRCSLDTSLSVTPPWNKTRPTLAIGLFKTSWKPLFFRINLWDTFNILEGFESLKLTTPIPIGHSLTHAHYAVWHVGRLRRIATSVGSGPTSGWYAKWVGRSILFISFKVEVSLVYFTVARRILCSSWFSSCFCEREVGRGKGKFCTPSSLGNAILKKKNEVRNCWISSD